jgi:hypothetical protein
MKTTRNIVKSTACTAFIFALAAAASAKTLTTTTITASTPDEPAVVADDDNTMAPDANKKRRPQPGKGTASVKVTAAYEIDGSSSQKKVQIANKKFSTKQSNESVVGAFNRAQLELRKVILEKTGDTTNQDASAFYGVNAALVATSGSTITANDVTINTDAEGANAIFATGTNSKIIARNVTIRTTQNSSRGLDATAGGTVEAYDVDIETQGEHCAALATDRGGGTVVVNNGSAKTAGEGSPVLYSTGNITANNMEGTSDDSEIGVIEGKNSLTINGGLYSSSGTNAFMLYQSTSGDAEEGTSQLIAKNATFRQKGDGAFFYITNTDAEATLSNCTIKTSSDIFVDAAGNTSERGWGKRGSNGATFRLTLANMKATGAINCDAISTMSVRFGNNVVYTGEINADQEGTVDVNLSRSAKWNVTQDSYVAAITDDDAKFTNIKSNGNDIYYDKNASANKVLKGRTIKLNGGGKLIPYSSSTSSTSSKRDDSVDGRVSPPTTVPDGMNKPGYGEGGGSGAGNLPVNVKGDSDFTADISDPVDVDNRADNDDRPQPPKLDSLNGKIKVTGKGSKQTVDLLTRDGKRYSLSVMDQMRSDNNKNNNRRNDREPPKMVTMEQLAALDGESVTLRGLFTDDDKRSFTVFEYTITQ